MGSQRKSFKTESFILSVDVGTSLIKCHVYDKEAHIRGSCSVKVQLLFPEVGHVEMDPDALWEGFITVVTGAVQDAGVHMHQMEALGISTQRATFTTWDRNTGVPFHNFISWQDLRAADLVRSWNRSCTMKAVHGLMKVLYFLTRQKRLLAGSLVVFSTQHVTFRLVWALTHYKQVRQAVAEGNCCFGTIDTWLLYKLTKGRVHATDYSNASTTGIFDSYQMCWSGLLSSLVSLPPSIFPKVENTGRNFGSTDQSIFGVSIPIMSVMADQQAAMFGECCFDVGDVKITMGTGTFMDINTGSKPHTSVAGLYPVVGWKIGSEVIYMAEGNSADTGTAVKWAQKLDQSIFGVSIPIMSVMADQQAAMFGECCFDVGDVKITMGTGTFMDINTGSKPHTSVAGLYPVVGWKIGSEVIYMAEGNSADTGTAVKWAQKLELFSDVKRTSAMAYSVKDSDGVCFVPSFSGLQAPLNDPKACASLMGLKPSTTKNHLVRAILESIAFRNKQLFELMLRETCIPIKKIRMDGGVSTNDFVMQLTADLFGRKVARPEHHEMSCLGAAFVAGLEVGFWKSREELKKLQSTDKIFLPRGAPKVAQLNGTPNQDYPPVLQSWEGALKRSMNWYKT